ncbi:MAG: glycosyltransferase [Candidatus Roizmanbacteria bacterium]|nr:glycosyltransferase [Candidatus Roizmanbacteria bacterium]
MMKVSIVIPVYNEVQNLKKGVLDTVLAYAKSRPSVIEVLIVDDGSTDDTVALIKKNYLGNYPKLRLYEKKHAGKAYGVIAGMKQAKGTIVFFTDMDLATPIEEADKLVQGIEDGYDVVIGSRNSNRQGAPIIRKAMALGFIVLRTLLVGLRGIHDTQCGFKAFKTTAARTMLKKLHAFAKESAVEGPSVGAGFDIELLFVAQKLGYKIKEVPVPWRHVETKRVNFITDSIEAITDMTRIKWNDIRGAYN